VGLTRANEDLDLPSDLEIGPQHMEFLRGQPDSNDNTFQMSVNQFREREVALLQMIGLSHDLAAKHVDEALKTVRTNNFTIRSKSDLYTALRDAAAAACRTHDEILESRRTREKGRQRRLTLRRLAVAFGGAVIVAADAAGDALGGFGLLTAASATLGAGAAGATANLIEG
jgi:hypothetical protein